jgi:LysR family nitrogen assimilation transcriptional regulator
MLDPAQLQTFLHVVDTGALSRAARRAHLSQPALSRQIRLLEDSLGAELFERTGRGMRLTAAGRRLEPRARALVAELLGLEGEFKEAPVIGLARLGISPSIGMAWTAGLVRAFTARYPGVQLRVSVLLSGAMGPLVSRGSTDLGILYTPLPRVPLRTAELWQEPSFFVCRRDHPHAACSSVTARQALSEPLLVPSSQFGVRAALEQQADNVGATLNVALEVDSMQLALELARQGAGSLILTERALPDGAARKLRAVRIHRPSILRTALLAGADAALVRPAVRALWDFVLEYNQIPSK